MAGNENMTAAVAHKLFVARATRAARSAGKTVVLWDEAFDLFGGRVGAGEGMLHPDTVKCKKLSALINLSMMLVPGGGD